MAQSKKDLEKQLVEFGNALLSPPSSVTELLSLLDRVEKALVKVKQSKYESLKKALSPSIKALISDGLLRHQDVDVKVSVASCFSEITRISAPDVPYEDDQMKEVFKLIVSSLEHLDDKTSRSYIKRASILEMVAKVRSCLVMLDLECYDLIVEMFGHFFRSIRDDHPESVFSSMETIMVVVLEESEEMSVELLSPVLSVLKTENKGVLPVARQLAENVVEKCASKLKPYLLSAVKSQSHCLDNYSKVLSNVCGTEGSNASKDVGPPSEEVGLASVGSQKSVMSNGTLQKETGEGTAGNTYSKEACKENNEAKSGDEPAKTDADSLGVEEPVKSQSQPEKSSKRKGRKTVVSKGSLEPFECSQADDLKKVKKDPEDQEKDSKETDTPVSPWKMPDNVDADAAPPSCGENLAERRSKKIGRKNKKDNSVLVNGTKGDGVTEKESNLKNPSEGSGGLEIKSQRRSARKVRILGDVDASNKEDETKEVEAKLAKKSSKKVPIDNIQCEDKTKGQVKATPAKDVKTPSKSSGKKFTPKSSGKSTKDGSDVKKTVQASSKRKQRPADEKASKIKEYGAELVGTRVKVWWPQDKKFYVGVVKFFDDVKKKHTVLYDDNDVEILKLAKEKWEIVSEERGADEVYEEGPDESSEKPKAKKTKTSAAQGSKQGGKGGTSSEKRDVSSSKLKATPKSGLKKKDDTKTDGKSEVESSKSGGKSKDTKTGKKSSVETPKLAPKPKDNDNDAEEITKRGHKLKQDTPEVSAKSKKSGSKSKTNGSHKVKAISKDSRDEDSDMSPEPAKTTKATKRISSSNTSKSQKSETVKKRKISTKS